MALKNQSSSRTIQRINEKQGLNIRTDKRVNFLLALAAILVFTWIVIESYTVVQKPVSVQTKEVDDDFFEPNAMGDIYILPESPKGDTHQSQQSSQKPKVELNKPVLVDDIEPIDEIEELDEDINVNLDKFKQDESEKNDNQKTDQTSNQKTGQKSNKVNTSSKSIDIPFVSQAPIHPDCQGITDQKELMDCFNAQIQRLVQRKFDVGVTNDIYSATGVHSIGLRFVVDKNGKVTNIEASAKHDILAKEAVRVLKKLPRFEPGSHNGQPVNVRYTLPISVRAN